MADMYEKVVYQTVEYRNPSNCTWLTQNGPIKALVNTYLGSGYYYWEGIKLAHKWGKLRYSDYGKRYCIYKTCFRVPRNQIFDIYANDSHIEEFEKLINYLESLGKNISVTACIELLKRQEEFKIYKVIRAEDRAQSFGKIFYRNESGGYFNRYKAIMICIIDKESIKDYSLIENQE